MNGYRYGHNKKILFIGGGGHKIYFLKSPH